MKWIALIKKLVASLLPINLNQTSQIAYMSNLNYIMALNPMEKEGNINGYVIIIMIISVVVLIGYTIVNNSKDK